jgi:hypothetical protein
MNPEHFDVAREMTTETKSTRGEHDLRLDERLWVRWPIISWALEANELGVKTVRGRKLADLNFGQACWEETRLRRTPRRGVREGRDRWLEAKCRGLPSSISADS